MTRKKEKTGSKSATTRRIAEKNTTKKAAKSKKQICIELLARTKGASLVELQQVTGWQAHSVRGFLSGTAKKLPEMRLETIVADGKPRRYRVVEFTEQV